MCWTIRAEGHYTKVCEKNDFNSQNCTKANEKYQINRITNHTATDFETCESYKYLFEWTTSKTEYRAEFIWSDVLKMAEVVFLYSKPKKNKVENYGPISLLSKITIMFQKQNL